MPWWRDRILWLAMGIGALLRIVPMALYADDQCVRDECTYIRIAQRMVEGEGMTSSAGWLWAPAYPTILAFHKWAFGYAATVRGLQLMAAMVSAVLIYVLARRVVGEAGGSTAGQRAGRIASVLYMLSPVMTFYTVRLWSEALYSMLLLGCFLVFDHVRRSWELDGWQAVKWGVGLGGLVGLCMLFRGVATYMVPIFLVGVLWRRFRSGKAWAQVAVAVASVVVVVGPYSAYATNKFGDKVVSDRTLGQMMWLGNNDFVPITFDYGNGSLSPSAFRRHVSEGRAPCAGRQKAMERDTCQTEEGVQWIKENPSEFLARMPMRVAQLLNPHSLLTRHLRWGKWKGPPQWFDELVVVVGAGLSMLVVWGGALGLATRGRFARSGVVALVLCYHCGAIACLAGLTRYRVPLEPLLMVYLGAMLAQPREGLALLRAQPWRILLGGMALAALVPLVLWYLPSGWPGWRSW